MKQPQNEGADEIHRSVWIARASQADSPCWAGLSRA
jgi:hypothetical protein